MNIYDSVPAAHLKRSMFHWKIERNQTQDMGAIVPFFWREMLPGDVAKINQSNFIRVQPMVAAPFTPIRFYSEFWFFPTRCLMQKYYPDIVDAWQTFIFGGPNGDGQNEAGQTPTLPLWIPNSSGVRLAGATVSGGVQTHKTGNADAKGSLWDYFGLPVNQGYHNLSNSGEISGVSYLKWIPLAFGKIAYNWLWNEFKRNENIESSVSLNSEDIQFCKWKKDRYTSALPFQQRGAAVALPLGSVFTDFSTSGKLPKGYAYLSTDTDASATGSVVAKKPQGLVSTGLFGIESTGSGNFYKAGVSAANVDDNPLGSHTTSGGVTFYNYPLLTNAQTSVSDLRLMFQTQKFLERTARGGARYIEGLKSFFGTSPRSEVLNLPQFVGGMKQNIIINEVLQTSETSTTPQGNIAGRGISAAGENIGTYSAKEHGYLLGICWIKPDLYYQSQGVKKEWLRRSKYDFYWPQFAHLSEQPIAKAELYADLNTMTPQQLGEGTAGTFGYSGIYNEYRSCENEICGEMRDTFKYWHLARNFSSAPELNSDFITCFPRKDIFAVQTEDEFMLDILTDVKMYRPIPVESNPGLIDHM